MKRLPTVLVCMGMVSFLAVGSASADVIAYIGGEFASGYAGMRGTSNLWNAPGSATPHQPEQQLLGAGLLGRLRRPLHADLDRHHGRRHRPTLHQQHHAGLLRQQRPAAEPR